MPSSELILQNVTKRFSNGITAVQEFSLTLMHGVLGFLGPNGAGKTTVMQMIATVTRPTEGRIMYDGIDICMTPDVVRRRLGYLPQDFNTYDNLTAREFLTYIASLKGVRSRARIQDMLEQVNLHTEARRIVGTFSGGMRQRLGIAQAFVNDPDIVIVDEPTAGLDPEERLRFRAMLSDFGTGKLVILSTHIVSDVETIATRLAIMNRGRLLVCAAPEELLSRTTGAVWETRISSDEYDSVRSRFKISRTVRDVDGMRVRMVHPGPPMPGAEAVSPDLEEAFIYAVHFGTPGRA